MAKIAIELERALRARRITGAPGAASARVLAEGDGWRAADVLCTCGPDDRPFEERHDFVSIAVVAAGTFQYRAHRSAELMSPGSLLLGSPGQLFECAHPHGAGDRCLSFRLAPELFEAVAGGRPGFRAQRIPPLRQSAALIARAVAALDGEPDTSWEELAVAMAGSAARLANGEEGGPSEPPAGAMARVTRAVRAMERGDSLPTSLGELAREARLSPYHFLRTFARIAGVTPHQFALRARLRDAAVRLRTGRARVIDVALDCGFGDVSNFNRAFRAEFGVSPRQYRRGVR